MGGTAANALMHVGMVMRAPAQGKQWQRSTISGRPLRKYPGVVTTTRRLECRTPYLQAQMEMPSISLQGIVSLRVIKPKRTEILSKREPASFGKLLQLEYPQNEKVGTLRLKTPDIPNSLSPKLVLENSSIAASPITFPSISTKRV